MLTNELKLPFAFYPSRLRQHRFRKNCGGQLLSGLLTPNNILLPFQIRIDDALDPLPTITELKLYDICSQVYEPGAVITDEFDVPITELETGEPLTADPVLTTGSVAYDLSADIGLISLVAHNGGVNIIYKGDVLSQALNCGYYELKIVLSNNMEFWSEIFHVIEYPEGVMPYPKLKWKNGKDLARIKYATGYESWIYTEATVSHAEPQITEEVVPDGIGVEIPVFVRVTSRFILSDIVPDFLKTAIAAIPVCSSIVYQDPASAIQLDVTRARINSQAESAGCTSYVELALEIDDEVYRTACE